MSKRKDEYSDKFNEDCKGYPPLPDALKARNRIIAIGDVHGDLHLTITNLIIAKVIEKTKKSDDTNDSDPVLAVTYEDNSTEYFKWIGKDTVVVQVGDQVDRCRPIGNGLKCVRDKEATVDDEHSDIKIIDLFTELNKLAALEDGMVISLLGNHELMNYQGNVNYVSYKGIHNSDFEGENALYKPEGTFFSDGVEGRKYAFKNKINEKLACTRQSVVIVGSFIFVHGGIVPELARKYNVESINTAIRKMLLHKIEENDSILQDLINSPRESPFWSRLYGHLPTGLKRNDPRCLESLSKVIKFWGEGRSGLKGMIVGHTPQIEKGINSTCGKKIWRVDIGASKAFDVFSKIKNSGRNPAVLEIIGNGKKFNILKE